MIRYLKARPGQFLAFTIVLNILIHLPFINLPPCSIHVWRQCNTLAVARNFYEEDGNILKPRVDRRFDTNGVTGMQFPAYEWVLSKIYSLTGEEYYSHRLFSLLLISCGLYFIAGFFRLLTGSAYEGALAAWIVCWSPEVFYQCINALPDIMAFSCAFAALYFSFKWFHEQKKKYRAAVFFLITMAGLIKIQFGIVGIFIAVHLFSPGGKGASLHASERKGWLLYGLMSILLVSTWYIYANRLIETSGLYDYVLNVRPISDPWVMAQIVKKNIISDVPELLLNYSAFILLLAGLFTMLPRLSLKRIFGNPFVITGLSFMIWYFLMLEQMRVHQYYLLPVLLITTHIILQGAKFFDKQKYSFVLVGLLLLQPVLASIRILPARWMKTDLGIPAEFANQKQLQVLKAAVPADAPTITGPDKSGCIWLYFLHKKGFSFGDSGDFFRKDGTGKNEFKEAKKRGAQWLYIRKGEINSEQEGLLLKQTIGQFEIYKVTQ